MYYFDETIPYSRYQQYVDYFITMINMDILIAWSILDMRQFKYYMVIPYETANKTKYTKYEVWQYSMCGYVDEAAICAH